jgi:glycerol uptake facilitator-like aquaporin
MLFEAIILSLSLALSLNEFGDLTWQIAKVPCLQSIAWAPRLTSAWTQNAAPLCIGLAVVAGVFAEGPFTGGSMNPARSIGAAVAFLNFKHLLIYIIATISGGVAAGLCYDKVFLEDIQPAEIEDRDEGDYEPSA